MLSFLKKKKKPKTSSPIEEIASPVKTVESKPQTEESFIDRTPYKVLTKVINEVIPEKEELAGPPERFYAVPSHKKFPMVTFLTKESISSPYLIPVGKSKLTGFEIYRYTGDNPKIIHDICFKFGCAYEEIYQ